VIAPGIAGGGVRAFGVNLAPEFELPGAWKRRPLAEDAMRIVLCDEGEIEAVWSGGATPGWEGLFGDGERFMCLRGRGGDHHFAYGAHATFHLSCDGRLLRCAPSDPADLAWQRVLLDSVLFTVALLSGYEALHAATVASPQGAWAIAAFSGGGKSTLCSELLSRGHALVADDVSMVSRDGDSILVHPGPPVMNLPAVRAGDAGRHITTFPDDAWVEVPVVSTPRPLAAVVLLSRFRGATLACERVVVAAPLRLLPNILRFPRTIERMRFDLACDIAAQVPIVVLSADLDVTPADLADELNATIGAGRPSQPGAAVVLR